MYISSSSAATAVAIWLVLSLVAYVLTVIGLWVVFEKAGEQGWKAVIPIYNLYVTLKVVRRPGWWLVLYLIPVVNLVITIIVYYDLARSFGHGAGFTIGLLIVPTIFLLILGFGSSRYLRPGGPRTTASAA
jgi:hypothetical protein